MKSPDAWLVTNTCGRLIILTNDEYSKSTDDEKSTFVTCQQINRQTLLDQLTTFKNEKDVKFWILEHFNGLKSKMVTLEPKPKTIEETKLIYLVYDTNNELKIIYTDNASINNIENVGYKIISGPLNEDKILQHFENLKSENSESKNIWIVTNENDQLEILYADQLQDINEEWKDRIVTGPLTQQQLKYRILEPDLIAEGIAKSKKENGQYWIVDIVGSHFKLVKGNRFKVTTECNDFMKKNVGIAKIHLGPYDDKNEALEDLDVVNYSFYDKTIPVHWILTYEDKTFEVFYGNKDALKIKLADETCIAHGPFLHKNRIEYTKDNIYGKYKLRKPNYENGNRFVSQLIESVYRPSLEELQDNYSKINIDYPNIQYSVVAGPFTSEQSSKYIKTLKDNDEF
jgi:hypothetical protein